VKKEIIVMKKSLKIVLIFLGIPFTIKVSFISYLTGPELALSAFYILSIVVFTWHGAIWDGIRHKEIGMTSSILREDITFTLPRIRVYI
jgi:hypothetical protein